MPLGPPSRSLSSEFAIAVLIYVGALSASMLAAMCIVAVPFAFSRSNDEGLLFLTPTIVSCAGLLVNPAIFAAVAANHCRRIIAYVVPFTTILWLSQFSMMWWRHLAVLYEPFIVAGSALTGLALAYWVLRIKRRSFGTGLRQGPPITSH